MKHEIKCWPHFFNQTWEGIKLFEYRIDDRNYQTGDEVVLLEYDPLQQKYTGRFIRGAIVYVLAGSIQDARQPLPNGYCVFQLDPTRLENGYVTQEK